MNTPPESHSRLVVKKSSGQGFPWPRPFHVVIFVGNLALLATIVWLISVRIDGPGGVDEDEVGPPGEGRGGGESTGAKSEHGAAQRPGSFNVGGNNTDDIDR